MDFETGLHKAAREIWPNTKISKCSFHLMQAVKRAMQRIFGVTSPSKKAITKSLFQLCTRFPYVEWDEERVEQVNNF